MTRDEAIFDLQHVKQFLVESDSLTDAEKEALDMAIEALEPEQEDYTEMKREFLRMASYIDVILECSDEQKETLLNFISRLAEFMPWTERD